MSKRECMKINYNDVPIYSVSLAFNEAVRSGRLTEKNRKWIEDRADEISIALFTGHTVEPQPDGSTKIVEPQPDDIDNDGQEADNGHSSTLTIGGEEQ